MKSSSWGRDKSGGLESFGLNDIIIACHYGLKISQHFDTYKKWCYDNITP